MSNEERLERIKDTHNRCVRLKYDSITWLITQAEHAQHLERKYENTGSMFGRQAQRTLIDENKRLREALDFYANKENYDAPYLYTMKDNVPVHDESNVDLDFGKIARQILEDNK